MRKFINLFSSLNIDFVYYFKSGAPLLVSEVLTGMISLGLSIFLANEISKDFYGEYKMVLSVIEILTIFSISAAAPALIKAISNNYDGTYWKVTGFQIKSSLLATLVAILISLYYLFFENNLNFFIIFLLVSLFIPFYAPLKNFSHILNGKKKFTDLAFGTVLTQVLIASSLILTIIFFPNNLIYLICSFIFANLLATTILSKYATSFLRNDLVDKKVLSFGLKQTPINIGAILTNQLDKILIFYFLGPIQVATYLFAIAIPEQIKGVFYILPTLLLPKYSEESSKNYKISIIKKSLVVMLIIILIIIVYILIAPLIFSSLFPKYMDSVIYSQLFSISLVTVIASLPMAGMQSNMESSKINKILSISMILQITTMILGLMFFNLIGLIVARILHRFAHLAITYFYYSLN